MQSNGVSYEVSDGSDIIKAHHKQLKLWHNPPDYLLERLPNLESEHNTESDDHPEIVDPDSSHSDSLDFPLTDSTIASSCDSGENDVNLDNDFVMPENDVLSGFKVDWITQDLRDRFALIKANFLRYTSEFPIIMQEDGSDAILEKSTLDWSFTGDGSGSDECKNNEYKMSSPMFRIDRNIIDLSGDMSPVVDKESQTVSNDFSNIDDSFLLWIEQSLRVQEDLVDRVKTVSSILNDAWIDDMSDVLALDSCPESTASGVDRDNVIDRLSKSLQHLTSTVVQYRKDRSSEVHRVRVTEPKECVDISSLQEISDIVPNMISNETFKVRRLTRSQGAVEQHPNVMSRPIEYKSHLRLL